MTAKPRVKVPSEALECERLVAYLKSKKLRFTHIPNSTNSKKQGVKNKRMGTSPGVPDYLILVAGRAVWIEMKRRKGGRVSPEQKEWIAALFEHGQTAFVCEGFDSAKEVVEGFLSEQVFIPKHPPKHWTRAEFDKEFQIVCTIPAGKKK